MDDDDMEQASSSEDDAGAPSQPVAPQQIPRPRRQSSMQYLESVNPVAAAAERTRREAGQAEVARIKAAGKLIQTVRKPRYKFGLAKGPGGD
jgi:hypothetical protein